MIDLHTEQAKVRQDIEKTNSKQKIKDLTKRLKMIEAIRNSENKSEWMVMDVIPVIPPDLRPLVLLESGNFATSDLNDLYRRIINRNNRLKKLVDLNAPEVIIRNEKRMLQQAVDALFDNGRCRRPVLGSSNRPLKSLTDMIKGKQGRFRENLLGKRVDYSARSVIVVGPELKLHQCGLPKKIALELYQPFIIRRLKEHGLADTIKSAKKMLERRDPEVWDILEECIYQHPVMLNRAPTLHRMGIQAFEPVLVEGNAIKIHPLVCKGFNADFDGDQMAVHLPLSLEAQTEAHVLMLAPNNIFSPANGSPIISPSQDIVLGTYYITVDREGDKGEFSLFKNVHDALYAYDMGRIKMHSRIFVRVARTHVVPSEKSAATPIGATRRGRRSRSSGSGGTPPTPTSRCRTNFDGTTILTTVGRCIFNDVLPAAMPFYNCALTSAGQSRVIADCYAQLGRPSHDRPAGRHEAARLQAEHAGRPQLRHHRHPQPRLQADDPGRRPEEGRRHREGLPPGGHHRPGAVQPADRAVGPRPQAGHRRPDGDPGQRLPRRHRPAGGGQDRRVPQVPEPDQHDGHEQGPRLASTRCGSWAACAGLMAKPSGEIIETPIKANFREGLSVLEYFSSTHGARKGLADTALKTADSGYLTRKLADVAQNVIINEIDCGTVNGVTKTTVYKGETVEVELKDMIVGRTARDAIRNPITDETIVDENETITNEIADAISGLKMESIRVRSPLTCESGRGICARCYGVDMSTNSVVEEGLAVGIIAAQSIGEPGTQLTMRTFHTGGVAQGGLMENDIKSIAGGTVQHRDINAVPVKQEDGTSRLVALKRNGEIVIVDAKGREIEKYKVPYGAMITAGDGEKVKARQQLVMWDPHITPILAEKGGTVRYEDIEEGETARLEEERKGGQSQGAKLVVIEHKGERHPRITIEGADGKILDFHYLPAKARIEVVDGEKIEAGHQLARQPKESSGTMDITGGLPRVTEIFEARKPKDPAVLAEISGTVEIKSEKRRGKMTILVKSETGMEREHHVPQDKELQVHAGDYVEAGDPLIRGPIIPHDILRIKGEEALYQYLLTEVQNVYRSQGVKINDKHIEIILNQMLRKVKIEDPGDTKFLPGEVVDKYRFRQGNDTVTSSVRVVDVGGTEYKEGDVVLKAEFKDANEGFEAAGKDPAKAKKTKPARGKTLLLGITKASLQSESFISAASFQETTKVLTEAALAGAIDTLVGLKENVILGHLIPAGTAFNPHLNLKIKHLASPSSVSLPEPSEAPVAPAPRIPKEEPVGV